MNRPNTMTEIQEAVNKILNRPKKKKRTQSQIFYTKKEKTQNKKKY